MTDQTAPPPMSEPTYEYEDFYPTKPALPPMSEDDNQFYESLYPPTGDPRRGGRLIREAPDPDDVPRPAAPSSDDEALYRAAYPEEAAAADYRAKFPKGIST